MRESRWLRWLGPGVIAVGAVGLVASTATGAGQRPWTPRPCATDVGGRVSAARSAGPIGLADLRLEPWFRLDPRLDRTGALQGQRLALGTAGNRWSRIMDLPPESFAAGPFGRTVLVGSDDGSVSSLEAVDIVGECSWAVARESAVIRRATVDPGGATVYETRVDRTTRADLGVWARPLQGGAPPVRILEPIGADERFGRTFTTELTWDLHGRTLAVQSCGEIACRTRIVDPADGTSRTIADPGLASLVGLDGDVLVSYAVCPGLPCPIVATELASGVQSVLADASGTAVAIATPNGPRVVHEVLGETGIALRSVGFDGSPVDDLGLLSDGRRLHPSALTADAATGVPSGWVVLSPDGRLPDTGPGAQTQLRRVPDGMTVQLDEVAR